MVVIAHFSKWRLMLWSVLLIGLAFLCYPLLTEGPPAGMSSFRHYFFSSYTFTFFPLLFAISGIAGHILLILRQLILRGGTAIWIADAQLNYCDFTDARLLACGRLSAIQGFSIGRTSRFFPVQLKGVVISLKNGERCYISTLLLSEPREVICSRLTQAIPH